MSHLFVQPNKGMHSLTYHFKDPFAIQIPKSHVFQTLKLLLFRLFGYDLTLLTLPTLLMACCEASPWGSSIQATSEAMIFI